MKAGIYFSHYECFGHTSRVIAISQSFRKKFPSGNFFFIQAGVHQRLAKLDQFGHVYSLPSPFINRDNFRKPVADAVRHAPLRAEACLDIISREKPELLITEFFPLGREESRHELIPALVKAAAQGTELWAVAGYPLLIGSGDGWRQKVLELYKRIIIFAPEMEKDMIATSFTSTKDRQNYNDFFSKHEEKIVFAGYLLPQGEIINYKEDANVDKIVKPSGACSVAVVRGGGAYYPKIIAEAIRASEHLGEKYFFTVVAGPSTTPEEWYFFFNLLANKKIQNVLLLKSIVDYEGLIRDSDVCVATASYHTAVMLLKHQKKAVIIPFEGYGKEMAFQEQPARAAMLQETISAEILSIKDMTAVTLAAAIDKINKLKPSTQTIPRQWFTGADFLDKALTELSVR